MTFKLTQVEKQDTIKSDSVMIKQQIIVKSQVDDKFKDFKKEELEKNLLVGKDAHKQLTEHLQTLQGENSANARKQLEEHLQKIVGQIAVMQYQLQTLNDLKVGDYFTEMSIEGFTTLKKGDNLKAKLGRLEIIIKGDIIHDIKSVANEEKRKPNF